MVTTNIATPFGRISDPLLRWRVWVDWVGDGSWQADSRDISDDVLALRWGWGRRGLPVPEFASPAALELTLRNEDHRYTPGNDLGPLGSNVKPGKSVWLRANWIYDDFAAGDGAIADLNARLASTGQSWEVLAVPGNGFVASGGVVSGQGGGWPPSDAVALLDTGDPLATLTVRYQPGSNGLGGFVLRCVARDDCLRLRFANDVSILERVSGRTVTRLADGAMLEVGAWYDLEIQQTGDSVRVFALELDRPSAVRREIVAASGIANTPDSGRHGLWHGFRNAQDRWAEFGVGRSLFAGRIAEIAPDYDAGVCRVTAADVMERLEKVPLHRALPGGLMRSGNVGAAILGWAGLLPGDYALDGGRLLLTGGPRAVWDVSAERALRRLQREEHGFIYVDGLGRVRLEEASARSGVRSHADPITLARFSIGDSAVGGPYATELRQNDGADIVEDSATFRYRRSSDAGRQRVWSLNEPLEIPASGELLVLAATDAWDVIAGLDTPVPGTDYNATDDAAGTGADVTGDVTVELIAEAESGVNGRGHVVRIRNGGSNAAYLQRLDVHADHCWRAESSSAVRAETADFNLSMGTGRGSMVSCRYADNYAAAKGAAEARLADRSGRHAQVEVALPLLAAQNHRAVVEGRLSDVVEARAASQGITGAWLMEGVEVSVRRGGEGEARWWLTAV